MADKPRLFIRVMPDVGSFGHRGLMLCTEDGKPFGMQTACAVKSEVDDVTMVTVTLYVDGDAINFAD